MSRQTAKPHTNQRVPSYPTTALRHVSTNSFVVLSSQTASCLRKQEAHFIDSVYNGYPWRLKRQQILNVASVAVCKWSLLTCDICQCTCVWQNFTVHVNDGGFEPKVLSVNPGDRVWWVWQQGRQPHNIVQVGTWRLQVSFASRQSMTLRLLGSKSIIAWETVPKGADGIKKYRP